MPTPDPVPIPSSSAVTRFWHIMRWMALASVLVAVVAVALVASGSDGFHIHMLIATALGAGLSVLLAGALMSLIFLSSASGHDESAGRQRDKG
ncbi:MAG: hypothetical protein M3Q52_00230 [Pseudomonadota bacterium]|nr:hypothetical protein [Pseudomonadota bacterium]